MKELLCQLVNLYIIGLILRIVLSWFPMSSDSPVAPVRRILERITDPLLVPLRRVLPPMAGFDLSPMILILGLRIVVQRLILNC